MFTFSVVVNRVKRYGILSIPGYIKWRFFIRYKTIIVDDFQLSGEILARNQISTGRLKNKEIELWHSSDFAHTRTISGYYPRKTVLYLKDVTVWARYGVAADSSFRIISETAFCESRLLELNDNKQLRNFPILELYTPFAVFGQGWGNYYHWLIDDMSSLSWLTGEMEKMEGPVTLVVGGNLNNEQFELLSGAVSSNVVIYKVDPDTRVTGPLYLFVPSAANSEMAYLPAEVITEVMKLVIPEEISNKKDTDYTTRFYISRINADKRRVTNEDELIESISKFGFRTVYLEHLTIEEQAKLFSSARMIIGQHGAGLANLVFCDDNCKVLEIHSHVEHHHYRWLAKAKKINYSNILVKSANYNSDIVVPIVQVCDWIDLNGGVTGPE